MKVIRKEYEKSDKLKKYNSQYHFYLKRLADKGHRDGAKSKKVSKFDVEANISKFVLHKPTYFVFIEHNWMTYLEKESNMN
jgi:hypothetical protein